MLLLIEVFWFIFELLFAYLLPSRLLAFDD